jgi:glycerol-3-phosphate dehydrogenase subunit B
VLPDVIVIGSGLAGLAAALRAAEAGAKTALLAKGIGTTHWAAGWVDVLGYWPLGSSDPIRNPREAVSALVAEEPDHPYARAGVQAIEAGVAAFLRAAAAGGVPYEGSLDRNVFVPTPAGARRPACLLPRAMRNGAGLQEGKTLIVGIAGQRDFYPSYICANLQAQGCDAHGKLVDVAAVHARRPQTTVTLAAVLEDRPVLDELINAVRPHVAGYDRIGFPAVLGLTRHEDVLRALEDGLGRPLFEIPTLPPSVPGVRLFQALRAQAARQGVRVAIGSKIVEKVVQNDRVAAVGTEAAARVQHHSAGVFILATGGILGGGIVAGRDGALREVALDLPVEGPPARESWFAPLALEPRGHAIFRAGIRVNGGMQPVDAHGNIVYGNVFAAGAVLAGADVWREKSHEGVALSTGFRAAEAATAGVGPSIRAGAGLSS